MRLFLSLFNTTHVIIAFLAGYCITHPMAGVLTQQVLQGMLTGLNAVALCAGLCYGYITISFRRSAMNLSPDMKAFIAAVRGKTTRFTQSVYYVPMVIISLLFESWSTLAVIAFSGGALFTMLKTIDKRIEPSPVN